MTISKELFEKYTNELKIGTNPDTFEKLDCYAGLLIEWNEKINLTAITQPDEILIKHFIDSMLLLKYVDIPNNAKVCDIGTGAGFPGAVISLLRPDAEVTMMDSVGKKLIFVNEVIKALGLNAKTVNIRAEDAGKKPEFREQFDVVTARAVSQLNKLSEYCLPLAKVNGTFSPLKAVLTKEEAQAGFGAAKNLGAELKDKIIYTLPDESEREIIIFKKITPTSAKYPRNPSQIAKKPL